MQGEVNKFKSGEGAGKKITVKIAFRICRNSSECLKRGGNNTDQNFVRIFDPKFFSSAEILPHWESPMLQVPVGREA